MMVCSVVCFIRSSRIFLLNKHLQRYAMRFANLSLHIAKNGPSSYQCTSQDIDQAQLQDTFETAQKKKCIQPLVVQLKINLARARFEFLNFTK